MRNKVKQFGAERSNTNKAIECNQLGCVGHPNISLLSATVAADVVGMCDAPPAHGLPAAESPPIDFPERCAFQALALTHGSQQVRINRACAAASRLWMSQFWRVNIPQTDG